MNSDLRRRLKQFDKFTRKEWKFLDALEARFIEETTTEWVTICYEPIESDDDDTAYVDHGDGEFQVVLDSRLQFGTILDYLLHEFAHIGMWYVNEDDHGPRFGIEWARLYRIYLQLYAEWW